MLHTRPIRPTAFGRQGFTLIEIVVAMALLAIGVMGVLALFVLGAKQSAESIQLTRAVTISESVADALDLALRYPIVDGGDEYARFELPHAHEGDDDLYNGMMSVDPTDDPVELNGFYFKVDSTVLPDFDGSLPSVTVLENRRANEVLHLPYDAERYDGSSFNSLGNASANRPNIVWWYKEPDFRATLSSANDLDDIRRYAFRIEIRRSFIVPSSGQPSPGELFAVRVVIYKNFLEKLATGVLPLDQAIGHSANLPLYQADFYASGY